MRLVRKLGLLALMAIAAMAMAAPAAFGQIPLEAHQESTGLHCPAIGVVDHEPNGGCPVHAASTGVVVLRAHIFGIESTEATCLNEFEGVVDENAEGWITHQQLTDPPAGTCDRRPCREPDTTENSPWRAHGFEGNIGYAGYNEYLHVDFCVETLAGDPRPPCEVQVPFRDSEPTSQDPDPTLHHYEFGLANGQEMPGVGPAGFRCELVGHWETEEAGTNVEIEHT